VEVGEEAREEGQRRGLGERHRRLGEWSGRGVSGRGRVVREKGRRGEGEVAHAVGVGPEEGGGRVTRTDPSNLIRWIRVSERKEMVV